MDKVKEFVDSKWKSDVIPKIEEYIKIPNLSPSFVVKGDSKAVENQDKAMKLLVDWVHKQNVKGMSSELLQVGDRTPVLFIEVAASEGVCVEETGTVLMYGHMDKQPPFTGWDEGFGPYTPVIKDGKLYGRGGADDGYSLFCALTSLMALQEHGIAHSRNVIIIEASEESGSPDLPFYIDHLKDRIGAPNLVVCLDSGCLNYEQLWLTSSLRGILVGRLHVELLTEGVHSGDGSGVVPDTFRIARQLLDRIEDPRNGKILLNELHSDIPQKVVDGVYKAAEVVGEAGIVDCFPFIKGGQPVEIEKGKNRLGELALNRWWRPQLAITGASGLPDSESAGNVLRPSTTLTLSCRLPPTCDPVKALEEIKKVLEKDPPNNAKVEFQAGSQGRGWAAPPMPQWLENAAQKASQDVFGKDYMVCGEGGSIPFMGMLGEMFPSAAFAIVGVLGPGSNAHGPNEFLPIDFSSKLTSAVAYMLADHCRANVEAGLGQLKNKRQKLDNEDITRNFRRNEDGTKV